MSQKYCTVEDEYKKNKNLKKEDVVLIRDWLSKQAHLPKINELKIIQFLHACYYKIEPTKTCIENFYTVRAHWPEFIQNRDIFSNELQLVLHSSLGTILPLPSKENYVIMYSRLMNPSPDVYSHIGQLRLFDMITKLWFKVLGTTEGQILLMDMEGLSFGHVVKLNLAALRKHAFYFQEALPVRLKAIHMINVSPISDKILTMVRPFLNKGMIDIMHLHPKLETLFKYIPKEALPNEYGGEAGTFKELHEKQIKLMEENAEYFLEDACEIADESERQGKPKNLDDIFGTEGTFKKLDID